MRQRRKSVALLLASVMLLGGLGGVPAKAEEQAKTVDVMFLSDTHSHLDSFSTVVDGLQKAWRIISVYVPEWRSPPVRSWHLWSTGWHRNTVSRWG